MRSIACCKAGDALARCSSRYGFAAVPMMSRSCSQIRRTSGSESRSLVAWQIKNWGSEDDLTNKRLGELAAQYYGYQYDIQPISEDGIKRSIVNGVPVILGVTTHGLGNPHYPNYQAHYLVPGYSVSHFITIVGFAAIVSPDLPTVAPGMMQAFTVSAANGGPLPPNATYTWTLSGTGTLIGGNPSTTLTSANAISGL